MSCLTNLIAKRSICCFGIPEDIEIRRKDQTGNKGNILVIMELIAKYDLIVKEHLKNGQRSAKMLS